MNMSPRTTSLVVLLLALGMVGSLPAASLYWTNSAGGDFTNSINWRITTGGSAVPGSIDEARFSNQVAYVVRLTADTSVSNIMFDVRSGSGANLTLDLGGFTWTTGRMYDGNSASGTNIVTLTNGVLNATNANASLSTVDLVKANPGTSFTRLILASGSRLVATNAQSAVADTTGSHAELVISSNSSALFKDLRIGNTASSLATLLQTGGTNEVQSGGLKVGANAAGATGYYSIVGADAVLNATDAIIHLGLGSGGSYGQLAVSNGTVLAKTIAVGANAASAGQLTIAGGTVLLGGGGTGGAGLTKLGSASILLSGGTLGNVAGSNWNTSLAMTITNTGVGAIRFAPSGANTITLMGVLSGDGALIKDDSGTLVLTTNNTYGGGTTVSNGTLALALNGSVGSGKLTVGNAGTLYVTGMQTTVGAALTNAGNVQVINSRVTWQNNAVISGRYFSDPSTNIFATNLTVTASGSLYGSNGDLFVFNGNLVNQSTNRAQFNLADASVLFTNNGGSLNHIFDLTGGASLDLGAGWSNVAALATNFAIGKLSLADGNSLTLLGASTNALYVGWLDLGGTTNDLASKLSLGINLYYQSNDLNNAYLGGLVYSGLGSGSLMPFPSSIPEPSALGLLAVAVIAGAVVRLRHRDRG